MESENRLDGSRLFLKAKNGDKVAMEAIVMQFSWMVRSVVRKYFVTGGAEEDLYQEGCFAIPKAVMAYDPERNKNVVNYMSMCIESDIKDALRTMTRDKHRVLNEAVTLTEYNTSGDGMPTEYIYDPVHNFIEREGLEKFYENVGTLCSELHVEILKFYLDGYTYSEIAAQMGVSAKKVDNVMTMVKKKIKANRQLFA